MSHQSIVINMLGLNTSHEIMNNRFISNKKADSPKCGSVIYVYKKR